VGVVLVGNGPAEALAAFDRAVALDPNNALAWNNRANALRAAGRRDEARAAYETALRLAPGDPDPRNGLGVLAVEEGRLDDAAARFREVLARAPANLAVRVDLVNALVRLGRADAAVDARVAIVEDHDLLAQSLGFALSNLGIQVTTVADLRTDMVRLARLARLA